MPSTALAIFLLGFAAPQAQQPLVQNGRVDVQHATIEAAVRAVGTSATPVWVGWRVPMIGGDRRLCSSWDDGRVTVRGDRLEPEAPALEPRPLPSFAEPSGPLQLESGTDLIVLERIVDGQLERLRAAGGDCPLDAGGRTLVWLDAVTSAESLRHLDTVARSDDATNPSRGRVASSAISAISMHRDGGADGLLDRLTEPSVESSRRRLAASALAVRGAHGFDRLTALLAAEHDASLRRAFAGALSQSSDPRTTPALLRLARTEVDAVIRGDAIYRYALRAGVSGLPDVAAVIAADANDTVRRRGVDGIADSNSEGAVTVLIDLATHDANAAVRKQAVSALGKSRDPRAAAFIEALVRG